MSYLMFLGTIEYAKDQAKDCPVDELGNTQVWFEGFVHGLNETGALTQEEMDNAIDEFLDVFTRPKQKGGEIK